MWHDRMPCRMPQSKHLISTNTGSVSTASSLRRPLYVGSFYWNTCQEENPRASEQALKTMY